MLRIMPRGFIKNRRGSAAIEFALLAPVFFYLVFGIIEVYTIALAEGILESSVRQAARSGLTGFNPAGLTRDEFILQQIEEEAFFINTDNIIFENQIYSSFENIDQPEPYTDENDDGFYDIGEPFTDVNANGQWDEDMGASGAGSAGDIVVYTIKYNWRFLTPFIGELMSDDGSLDLVASAVVRNEPF